jgi:hypothetical protein
MEERVETGNRKPETSESEGEKRDLKPETGNLNQV